MYTTDLENYEKSEAGAVSLVAVDDSDSDDSGPDVIIEQEEVIGSVGLPAAPPGGQNTRTQTTPDTHSLSRTGISNDNGTLHEDVRHDEDSLQADAPVNKTISDDMSKMSITSPSDAILPAPTSDSELPDIQSNGQPLGAAGTNTAPKPSTPKTDRKGSYTSVKDVLQDGSPIVKKLLSGEGAGSQHNARRSQAEDKFVQKTGKVVILYDILLR